LFELPIAGMTDDDILWQANKRSSNNPSKARPLLARMRSEVKIGKACNRLTGLSIRQVTVLSP